MTNILFVCTGNVFRSMSAELAMREAVSGNPSLKDKFNFASAGTEGKQDNKIHKETRNRLDHWDLDISGHVSRLLTQEIIDEADLVVAMSTDHQKFLKDKFNCNSVLFLDIAKGQAIAFPDLDEVIPDFRNQTEKSRIFIHEAIDKIVNNSTKFMKRLPGFLPPVNG